MPTGVWSKEELFFDGDSFFESMFQAIDHARTRIDVEFYIFESDEFGDVFFKKLESAAHRGISVRVLVDGIGSPKFRHTFGGRANGAGIQFRVYHELPWRHLLATFDFAESFSRWIDLLNQGNRRLHRKLVLIDEDLLFTGSYNISKSHLKSHSGSSAWRDTGACVSGTQVRAVMDITSLHWLGRGDRLRKNFRNWMSTGRKGLLRGIRTNHSLKLRGENYRNLIEKIRYARRRVWITTPYFVPDGSLLRALRTSAKLGADVRLLVPQKSDVFFMRWVANAFFSGLLTSGVRIFEYRPSVLHAKVSLCDDWLSVGSSNMNQRSLIHDLELDVVLYEAEIVKKQVEQFRIDITQALEIKLADYNHRPLLDRLMGSFFVLLRYWL